MSIFYSEYAYSILNVSNKCVHNLKKKKHLTKRYA